MRARNSFSYLPNCQQGLAVWRFGGRSDWRFGVWQFGGLAVGRFGGVTFQMAERDRGSQRFQASFRDMEFMCSFIINRLLAY